jgi:hypothetical protein
MIQRPETPPVFAYISIFLLGLLVSAAWETMQDFVGGINQREVLRVTSPDRQVDAILVDPIIHILGVSSGLYLVPRGEPVPSRFPQLQGVEFKARPSLLWKRPHLLSISYGYGCINHFNNLWHSFDLEDGRYYVEIDLHPANDFPCLGNPRPSPPRLAD